MFFLYKQKTAYEMRISDWSSDVCSSDLHASECAELSWVHMPAPGRQVHLLQMGGCGFRRFRPRYRRCLNQAGTPCRTSNALFDWKEPAMPTSWSSADLLLPKDRKSTRLNSSH